VTGLLAADPVLPQRDTLLDAVAVGRVLEQRLARSLPLVRCDVMRVKYRVGESLRARYRIEAGGRTYDVACRAFPAGASEHAFRRACEHAVPAGALQPIGWEPGLETVFWTFPNDRRLRLSALDAPGSSLVAYAPEKSATIRLEGGNAFAKVYAGDEAARTHFLHDRLAALGAPVPPALTSSAHVLLVESARGRSLADVGADDRIRGYGLLGEAVARLHELAPLDGKAFTRLDPDRLHLAAELVGRARPDAAAAAHALAARLAGRARDTESDAVCVHGDLHPKNVLVDAGVTIIDLDQVAGGAAAADIGGVLAGLRYAREDALAAAFLTGYASVRMLPSGRVLRWHTAAALLAERALRAVNRVRPDGLRRLRPLLADAASLLDD
jgi:streptomycin 6-kinase